MFFLAPAAAANVLAVKAQTQPACLVCLSALIVLPLKLQLNWIFLQTNLS
jgi:hypothetical protein